MMIIRQMSGRFDQRFGIGPACWPFHDLLWIHSGQVSLTLGTTPETLHLVAPAGVLIFPDTPFQGAATKGVADASVCHFTGVHDRRDGYLLPQFVDRMHVQNLLQLSLSYAQSGAAEATRSNLLCAICDCFSDTAVPVVAVGRLERVWADADAKLRKIRSLVDVADLAGLSEGAFRSLHRRHYTVPAGRFLQELRFRKAQQLLATTGQSMREISAAVGYAHPESFSTAFTRSRGQTPGTYRRWCRRLA